MGRRAIASAHVDRLAAIYRDHLRRVRWVLRARGIGSDEIDDVVHDVFLAIHNRLGDDEPALEMGTWVCGVARSVAFAHRRGDARRQRMIAAVPEPEAMRLPDEELARREAWLRLAAALDALQEDQRETFILVDVMGMRAAEAAQLVDAPLNTVYSRLRLARRHCETQLASLQFAASGELPDASRRRRTWAGIAAALPLGMTKSAGLGLSVWAIAAGVGIAVTIGVAATTPDAAAIAIETATAPREATRPTTSSFEPATLVIPPPPPEVVASTPPSAPPRRPSSPSPSPAPTTDDLAAAVELLRAGESAARRGDTTAALAIVDDYRARFGNGPLDRDALRLERRAACDARDPTRAERALAALVRSGIAAADELPCPS